jgi:hypothetical protein
VQLVEFTKMKTKGCVLFIEALLTASCSSFHSRCNCNHCPDTFYHISHRAQTKSWGDKNTAGTRVLYAGQVLESTRLGISQSLYTAEVKRVAR